VLSLNIALEFTSAEREAVNKVENYFKCKDMPLQEKLLHALLIAQHDLEVHNFTNNLEKVRILDFKNTVNDLLSKIRHSNADL
jgi:hypothetical protein